MLRSGYPKYVILSAISIAVIFIALILISFNGSEPKKRASLEKYYKQEEARVVSLEKEAKRLEEVRLAKIEMIYNIVSCETSLVDGRYEIDNEVDIELLDNTGYNTPKKVRPLNGDELNEYFSYSIGEIRRSGDQYPRINYVYNSSLTSTLEILSFEVEFAFEGDSFELIEYNANSEYIILVNDGEGYKMINGEGIKTVNDGSTKIRRFQFHTSELRAVKIVGKNFHFGGINIDQEADIYCVNSFEDKPSLVLMGDSYTEGSGAGDFMEGYPKYVSRLLDVNLLQSGSGGTGYVATGPEGRVDFLQRLEKDVLDVEPDCCVIAGGINDVDKDVNIILAQAEKIYEDVVNHEIDLIVVSPFWPGTPNSKILEINSGLKEICLLKHIPYIDVLTGMTYNKEGEVVFDANGPLIYGRGNEGEQKGDGNADIMTGSDGTHPTSEGHKLIGSYIAEQLKLLMN